MEDDQELHGAADSAGDNYPPRYIPEQQRCPVCGKRGRQKHELRRNGRWYYYLHCNPKARTGGKGCGELFKYLPPACKQLADKVVALVLEDNRQDRLVALGFEMVAFMKAQGLHQPYERKVLNRELYRPFIDHKKRLGVCPCGCGLPPRVLPSGYVHPFGHHTCADYFYAISGMITNQGEELRTFLIKLRGHRCEKCEAQPRYASGLEVDHIIEVNEGGGQCWIDNYQLLCAACHKAKTALYAAHRARIAREAKDGQSSQMRLF